MTDDRRPEVTAITATDRDIAYERGLLTAYLDVAIDALLHTLQRTNAGRLWVAPEDVLMGHYDGLVRLRDEVLRKEKTDSRNARAEEQQRTRDDRRWST